LRRNATSNESVSANARDRGLDIAGGLKEALNNGISKQVTKLTATDGFFSK
jgi:post-segregation antitoxin (ccd killing protein)